MKNNAAYYKQAIALLMVQNDWKDICVTIAQKHPKIFIEACPVKYSGDFEEAALREYRMGGMIPAIKYVRSVKGWGLKDSKAYVDGLKERHGI